MRLLAFAAHEFFAAIGRGDVLASLAIPSFHRTFDVETGSLTDPELDEQFRGALSSFAAWSGSGR
jgi:hypothetical protein